MTEGPYVQTHKQSRTGAPRRQGRVGNHVQALHANERAFKEAQDPFYIEQLTYQHAALLCRWRALLRILRADRENL